MLNEKLIYISRLSKEELEELLWRADEYGWIDLPLDDWAEIHISDIIGEIQKRIP